MGRLVFTTYYPVYTYYALHITLILLFVNFDRFLLIQFPLIFCYQLISWLKKYPHRDFLVEYEVNCTTSTDHSCFLNYFSDFNLSFFFFFDFQPK
jgi:hypothetical protein